MINPIPDVDICRSRRSDAFAIIHKAAMFDGTLYIGNGAWGNLERFSEANFDAFGLSTVRSSLAAFPGRRCDDTSEFEALGRLGKEAFFEEFQIIGPSLRDNGDIWLDPVHHKVRGISGFSIPAERVIVGPTATPLEFFRVVIECLNLAD